MFAGNIKKVLATLKNTWLPALLLAFAALWHSRVQSLSAESASFLHIGFYTTIFLNIVCALVINRTKSFFLSLWFVIIYLAVNHLRPIYGNQFETLLSYYTLISFLPLNFLYLLFRNDSPFFHKQTVYLLAGFLLQVTIIENLPIRQLNNFPSEFVWLTWSISLIIAMIYISIFDTIKSSGMFFAMLTIFLGLLHIHSYSVFCLYFSIAAFILLMCSLHSFIYDYYRDSLTGVYSRQSYYRRAQKYFPLKYSIGVVCIDDYFKLLKIFGQNRVDTLTKMIIGKIKQAETDAEIYRYNEDEFILLFRNEDKKHSYEYLENIRRSIAGAEFVISSKKIVKLTISAGVSEKKRSDADAETVLTRTRDALQKAYKFTQNITSQA